jgi:hypothetical protein
VFPLECSADNEVVLRRHRARPRSCSLRPRHGVAPSDRHYFVSAPDCFNVSGRFLRSSLCKNVVATCGRVGCRE